MSVRAPLSVLASLGLHAAVVGALLLSRAQAAPPEPELVPDVWHGNTVDIEALPTAGPAALAAVDPALSAPEPAEPSATEPSSPAAPSALTQPAPRPAPPAAEAPLEPDAKPAPRPRRRRPVAPAAHAAAPASGEAGSESAPGPARPALGGAESELPAGVRQLGKAFTRAITAATHQDPIWRGLPAGTQGEVTIRVELDADGRISSTEVEPTPLTGPLSNLVTRTLLLLRAGRFALASGLGAGQETLSVSVQLFDEAPSAEAEDPNQAHTLGFEPPKATAPGRAYFVLGSGRRFEATVRRVR